MPKPKDTQVSRSREAPPPPPPTFSPIGAPLPSDPLEAFDAGYRAGMAFTARLARQCGLDVDLTKPYEVMVHLAGGTDAR